MLLIVQHAYQNYLEKRKEYDNLIIEGYKDVPNNIFIPLLWGLLIFIMSLIFFILSIIGFSKCWGYMGNTLSIVLLLLFIFIPFTSPFIFIYLMILWGSGKCKKSSSKSKSRS